MRQWRCAADSVVNAETDGAQVLFAWGRVQTALITAFDMRSHAFLTLF